MELFSIRIQRTFQLVSTSIAAITVDYLRGKCAQEILCNIPLK